jgi:cytochrome c556
MLMMAIAASLAAAPARADEKKLPPGPIHDRHELMEKVGDSAKAIGGAMKAGKPADAAAPAQAISDAVEPFLKLFPPGSESPDSRAKPEIWTNRAEFDRLAHQLEQSAAAVAKAASSGGNVKAASQAMFKDCKACHDKFRVPEEDEDD